MKNIVLMFLLFTSPLIAQKGKIGIGVEYNPTVVSTSSSSDGIKISNVYFPIILNGFMFEPQISYYSTEDEMDYDETSIIDETLEQTDYLVAIGIYKTHTYKKTRAYFGIKLGTIKRTYEYSLQENEEESYTFYAPVIGGEYFIGGNFSFGIEAYFLMAFYDTEFEGEGTVTSSLNNLKNKMMFRVYF